MVRNGDLVAIFQSIHRVMKVEKVLKGEGVEFLLIPVPRQLSSDCGLAIRYAERDRTVIAVILRREALVPSELYSYDGAAFLREDV
jgi:hypothetical protein